MKDKRWRNIALGLTFILPVIGAYIGKRLLSKAKKHSGETLPEVTRIRIPLASLVGVNDAEEGSLDTQTRIVLPISETGENSSDEEKIPETEEMSLVASTEGKKFHYQNCRWAQNIKAENSLLFENRTDALERGFTPCGSCNP